MQSVWRKGTDTRVDCKLIVDTSGRDPNGDLTSVYSDSRSDGECYLLPATSSAPPIDYCTAITLALPQADVGPGRSQVTWLKMHRRYYRQLAD